MTDQTPQSDTDGIVSELIGLEAQHIEVGKRLAKVIVTLASITEREAQARAEGLDVAAERAASEIASWNADGWAFTEGQQQAAVSMVRAAILAARRDEGAEGVRKGVRDGSAGTGSEHESG